MTAQLATSAATVLTTCYKCHGTKRFAHFAGIDNGKCFTCNGTGKISVDAVSETEAYRNATAVALHTAAYLMLLTAGGHDGTASYSERLVADLRLLGKPAARKVRAFILGGVYWDESENRKATMPRGTAGPLWDSLVALARA